MRAHLLARAGHPLALRGGLTLADVAAFPLVQVLRLPPRLLKPFLAARGMRRRPVGTVAPPFPAIDCPSVDLALVTVEHSDAVMLGGLGAFRSEIRAGRLVPLLHEPWMRAEWAVTRLRRRSLGPAGVAFVEALRAAHARLLEADRAADEPPPRGRGARRPIPR